MPVEGAYQPTPVFDQLGSQFGDPVEAAEFPKLNLRYFNDAAAKTIGLDDLEPQEKADHFARFVPLPDNLQQPLALRYHGHQFRNYNPDLGDGRGFLFAQLADSQNRLLDLGTKGSGQTPWSRAGDGRLTLKGAVREILATEMLAALGVNTSKTFCVFETSEPLMRNDEPSPARSAVLTRLSHSHIRFGTFQRLAYLSKPDQMAELLNHIAEHYLPELIGLPVAEQAVRFLANNAKSTALMCASWMAAGFVHGVLNTDNMNINGESFDYGPWRFLLRFDPGFTAAYFDQQGLYAYGRQPEAVSWNLARLGEALSLLAPVETLQAAHASFSDHWQSALPAAFLRRLGLCSNSQKNDLAFVKILTQALHETQVSFDGFFFDWFGGDEARALTRPNLAHYQSPAFAPLAQQLKDYQPIDSARASHAWFQRETPETLVIEQVENLWKPIAEHDDWSLFRQKINDLRQMGDALSIV